LLSPEDQRIPDLLAIIRFPLSPPPTVEAAKVLLSALLLNFNELFAIDFLKFAEGYVVYCE
jgi:hypothetical protein